MKVADDAMLFKTIVKFAARKHGLAASFMAKPFADRLGNGLHTHFSILDSTGANVFDNGDADGSDASSRCGRGAGCDAGVDAVFRASSQFLSAFDA